MPEVTDSYHYYMVKVGQVYTFKFYIGVLYLVIYTIVVFQEVVHDFKCSVCQVADGPFDDRSFMLCINS